MSRTLDRVAAWGTGAAILLARALPPRAASALGSLVARAVGPLTRAHRTATTNLARALPELDAAARARVLRGMWDNLGRVAGELPHLAQLRLDYAGIDVLDRLRAEGRNCIFVSGHYGNWEVLGVALWRHNVDALMVYRAANNARFDDAIQRLRDQAAGQRYTPKGRRGGREIITAIRDGRSVAMLIDQKLNEGLPIPFFGRDAMTTPAAAELAARFGLPVVMARVVRLAPLHYRVEIGAARTMTGDTRTDLTALNATLEEWIRERPDHWFWVHRRWPRDGAPEGN